MAPLGVTFIRLFIGFLTLAVLPAARQPLAKGDGWPTAALSVIWLAFPLSMFPFAEQRVSSAIAGMLNGGDGDHRRHRRRCAGATVAGSRGVLTGLAVGVAGIVLMAVPSIDGASSAAGIAMIVAAVTSYGVAINLARPLQLRSGALPVVWRTLGVATALTAPLGLPAVLEAHWTPRAVFAMVMLGAFGTAIANVIMTVATGRLGRPGPRRRSSYPGRRLGSGRWCVTERVAPLSIAGAAVPGRHNRRYFPRRPHHGRSTPGGPSSADPSPAGVSDRPGLRPVRS